MDEKLAVFLDLAKKMNRKFSVIPLMYGSLGLQMQIEDDLHPDDIDICLPYPMCYFPTQWEDLVAFMQNEGFELLDAHEHFFRKGEIAVNFSVIDGNLPDTIPSLEVFTGMDLTEIPIIEADGAIYRRMTLEQYYKTYSQSFKDSYRMDGDNHKDKKKIDILRRVLGYTE